MNAHARLAAVYERMRQHPERYADTETAEQFRERMALERLKDWALEQRYGDHAEYLRRFAPIGNESETEHSSPEK